VNSLLTEFTAFSTRPLLWGEQGRAAGAEFDSYCLANRAAPNGLFVCILR